MLSQNKASIHGQQYMHMRERFGLVLRVLREPLSPSSFNETDSLICSLGTETQCGGLSLSSPSLLIQSGAPWRCDWPLPSAAQSEKARSVCMCESGIVWPCETCPEGLLAYFLRNFEISDPPPSCVPRLGGKGKRKNIRHYHVLLKKLKLKD